jgi:hypothetical protein
MDAIFFVAAYRLPVECAEADADLLVLLGPQALAGMDQSWCF